jgi:pectate disaccharide-lyase
MRGRGALLALIVCLVVAAVAIACSSGPPQPQPAPPPAVTPVVPVVPPTPTEEAPPRVTLHVSQDGDDAAPGTQEAPLRTITRAARLARPGTLVLVAAGRYEGPFRTAASGAADARITYRSEPVGAAVVVATGDEAAWRNLGDHVTIEGFTITGDAVDGLIDEGSFVRIIGNRVSGFGETCIYTGRGGYTLHDIDVINNVVSGCGSSLLDHGIYVSHPGGTVANNISYGNAGFGIHCWHNCNRLVISNNLVFDNDEGGILIGQGDSPNNGEVDADGFVVSNNIAVNNGEYGIRESGATGSNNHYINNNVFANAVGGMDLQTGVESGTIDTAPAFVDFRPDGSGDYRLLPGSPMIDAGTSEGAVDIDIVGSPRPRGGGVDIGVYEQ